MRNHSASFRTIALLSMVAMLLSACTSWQSIRLESGAVPNKVRITTESERFELRDARLVGDTAITGLWSRRTSHSIRRSVRLTDIRGLERGKIDALRTTVLTAGILAVAYVVVVAVTFEMGPLQLRRAR